MSTDSSNSRVPRVPWNPWLGVLFVVVIYYVAEIVGGLVVSAYPYLHHWSHSRAVDWLTNSTIAQFIYILLAEGVILGALYFFLKGYRSSFKTIGLKRPRWRDAAYGLMAVPAYYLFYLLSVGVVTHFVPGLNVDQSQQIGFTDVQGALALVLTFISLVVLPPLTEEIMVRGFLYSSLKKGLPTLAAVLGTSLIFAAAHLPEGGAAGPLYIAALDTFILSLVLIYLREKTGGLWASITLHAIKNGIAFVSLFIIHVK
ncbi:MAG TPA: CPBP family intramembrane glutamic endopeptidase [Candidatus Saccharimonadales bacterium]|nr:CPBP family intramembrane glutamic endopeptidase [Candidatus Saccharimonadales bacterium]